jgi:hypothetical protein
LAIKIIVFILFKTDKKQGERYGQREEKGSKAALNGHWQRAGKANSAEFIY